MKQCSNCQCLNADMAEHCEECGAKLPSYIESFEKKKAKQHSGNSNAWMYILCFLFPIIGLILGFIQLGKGNDNDGKALIIMSVIVSIISGLIVFVL